MKKFLTLILLALSLNVAQAKFINMLDFGAKNDSVFLNTEIIAQAIDTLEAHGGGTLYFPAGDYLTGPITLKSNVTIEVEAGASLCFSDNFDHYMPYVEMRYEGVVMNSFHPLIAAYDAENIAIKGRGTLEGNGREWWNEAWRNEGNVKAGEKKRNKYQQAWVEANPDLKLEEQSDWKRTLAREFFRPPFIQFYRCKNILIEGLHIQNSPFWTVNPEFCENLNIKDLTIYNPESPNTDGINPSSCKNVHISNCHISVGDDCITIKSGRDLQGRQYGVPCENITITNCTMLSGHGGVVIGSEMSGDVRKITISNCVFDGTDRGIRLKSTRGRGGIVEEIRVDNIVMKNIQKEAIIFNLFYSNVPQEPVSERTPIFRNIHISNMTGTEVKAAGGIRGIPEMPVSDISINNVNIQAENGFFIQEAKNVTISDFIVNSDKGPVLDVRNSEELYFDNVRTMEVNDQVPVIRMENAKNVFIANCFPKAGSAAFLELRGAETEKVVLQGNYLDRMGTKLMVAPEVMKKRNALILLK